MKMEEIRILQLNLKKCFLAQANLMDELLSIKESNFVCLVQEPHFSNKKPSSLNKSFIKAFHSNDPWPRAMILASKNLKVSIIDTLTNRDTTCATLHCTKL